VIVFEGESDVDCVSDDVPVLELVGVSDGVAEPVTVLLLEIEPESEPVGDMLTPTVADTEGVSD